MRRIVINIDEKDFEIIYNKVKDIRDEISNNGYANNGMLPIGWTSIADGSPLEEELEKLKEEIEKHAYCYDGIGPEIVDFVRIDEIFENHNISELKGQNKPICDRNICLKNEYSNIGCEDCVVTKEDNKQIRCNNCQNNTDELSGECYECVKGIEDWYEPIFDKDKSVKINGIETNFIIVDKNFITDEFEKLKAEFEEDRYILLNQTVAIQIIDKYIAELKGR